MNQQTVNKQEISQIQIWIQELITHNDDIQFAVNFLAQLSYSNDQYMQIVANILISEADSELSTQFIKYLIKNWLEKYRHQITIKQQFDTPISSNKCIMKMTSILEAQNKNKINKFHQIVDCILLLLRSGEQIPLVAFDFNLHSQFMDFMVSFQQINQSQKQYEVEVLLQKLYKNCQIKTSSNNRVFNIIIKTLLIGFTLYLSDKKLNDRRQKSQAIIQQIQDLINIENNVFNMSWKTILIKYFLLTLQKFIPPFFVKKKVSLMRTHIEILDPITAFLCLQCEQHLKPDNIVHLILFNSENQQFFGNCGQCTQCFDIIRNNSVDNIYQGSFLSYIYIVKKQLSNDDPQLQNVIRLIQSLKQIALSEKLFWPEKKDVLQFFISQYLPSNWGLVFYNLNLPAIRFNFISIMIYLITKFFVKPQKLCYKKQCASFLVQGYCGSKEQIQSLCKVIAQNKLCSTKIMKNIIFFMIRDELSEYAQLQKFIQIQAQLQNAQKF